MELIPYIFGAVVVVALGVRHAFNVVKSRRLKRDPRYADAGRHLAKAHAAMTHFDSVPLRRR